MQPSDRNDATRRQLEDLRRRLAALGAGGQPAGDLHRPARPTVAQPARQDEFDETLRRIGERLEALRADSERVAPPPRQTPSARRDDYAAAEAPAYSVPPERARADRLRLDLDAAIAEISERQRYIDSGDERPRHPMEPAYPAADEATAVGEGAVAAALDDLRRELSALTGGGEPRGPSGDQNALLESVRQRLDALDERHQADEARLLALAEQLGELRDILGSTARESTLATLESAYAHIIERLDDLGRRSADDGRFGELAGEILERLPPADRFDTISAEIDRLSQRVASTDRGALREIGDRLDAVERHGAELSEIRQAMKGLYKLSTEAEDPGIGRLERRLVDLSARIEAALNPARGDAVTVLADRLDDLSARIDQFTGHGAGPQGLESMAAEIASLRRVFAEGERAALSGLDRQIQDIAARLDALAAPQELRPDGLAHIERQISALAARLDSGLADTRSPEALGRLERQVSGLAARLDGVAAGPRALADLERQVGALSERLEGVARAPGAYAEVDAHLRRLEAALADTRRDSLESAQAAARQAVRELTDLVGRRSDDSPLIEALKGDLRRLQSATEGTEQRSHETMDAVRETLDKIVERLTRLESEAGSSRIAPEAVAAPQPQPSPARPQTVIPRADPSSRRRLEIAGSDRPPELGSGRASVEAAEPVGRDRKADFIAAARRAAQAAAAENAALGRVADEAEEDDEESGGPLSRIGRVLRGRRRPLLMAAAAVILAIAVVRLFGALSEGTGEEAVAAVPPAAPALAATVSVEPPVRQVTAVTPPIDEPATPEPVTREFVAAPVADDPEPPAEPSLAFAPPQTAPATGFGAAPAGPSPDAFSARFESEDEADIDPEGADGGVGGPIEAVDGPPVPQPAIGPQRLRLAAMEGDPAALFEVGRRYADGRDTGRDLAAAAEWFQRAAERGLAVAQFRLGSLYERGQGVAKDREAARQWYVKAAGQGNVQAMHNLAVLLSEGVAGEPDLPEAIRWFRAAAEHGIKDSQYNLGVIYARGIGTAQDLGESYRWFALAGSQGDADAAARRDDVAKAMSPDALAAARAAVSAWHASEPVPEANSVASPSGGWEDAAAGLDRRELVRRIQTLLAERGFDPGPPDGVEGPKTIRAVRAFQDRSGLEVTGRIDPGLADYLAGRPA